MQSFGSQSLSPSDDHAPAHPRVEDRPAQRLLVEVERTARCRKPLADLDVKRPLARCYGALEYPCWDANRRNARIEAALLLGRVLPSQDRGGTRDPVRDRRGAAQARAAASSRSPTGRAARRARGPLEITRAIRDEYGVGGDGPPELRRRDDREPAGDDRPDRGRGDREHPGPARRSAPRADRLRSAGRRPGERRRARGADQRDASRARDRRSLLPRGPSGGAQPGGRPRLPEDQGRERRELPDHPALLRQPALLRLRSRGARGRASTCRSSRESCR